MKLNRFKHRFNRFMRSPAAFPVISGTAVLMALVVVNPPASAQTVKEEMDKVKDVSTHLITVTQGMAEASILPVGISSSVKILRHVVLNNV